MDSHSENLKNLTVEEFTTPCPSVVSPETTLHVLETLIREKDIRHIPVEENNKIIGIISERDVLRAYQLENKTQLTARDIMHKDPYLVDSLTKISEVAFYMSKNKYGSALVATPSGELGIFTSTDALNALVEILRGDLIEK